jgi:hypothetical protein
MYKASNIMPLDLIQDNCIEIQDFIERPYDADNGNAVVERAQKIEAYMALSGKMLADAKYHYNQVFESSFVEAVKQNTKVSASTLNKYLDSLCKDYQYLVDWCDRINRTCTHVLDFSRTIVSKLKNEMRQFG